MLRSRMHGENHGPLDAKKELDDLCNPFGAVGIFCAMNGEKQIVRSVQSEPAQNVGFFPGNLAEIQHRIEHYIAAEEDAIHNPFFAQIAYRRLSRAKQ